MSGLLPVYYHIKQNIKNRILNGEFRPGDKIPSENDWAEEFKVSRLTARQAVLQLIQEGFLVRKRGKGTFVTANNALIDSFNLEFNGFMDDLFYQISKSRTKSVKITRMIATPQIRNKLEIKEGNAEIIRIDRVRFKGEKTFAYTVNYMPLETGMKISEDDLLKKPLLQMIEEDLGIKLIEAFQTIQATFADQELAGKLEIASGSPILYVERIMYTHKHKPVEFVQTSYRGDLYKYIVRLKNNVKSSRIPSVWVHQTK
jgi:GntR family transcriptional regulator